MKIKINEEYAVYPTPEELAHEFWNMDNVEQAQFFNHLAEIADRLPMQLESVKNSNELTAQGRTAMQRIGEYGE